MGLTVRQLRLLVIGVLVLPVVCGAIWLLLQDDDDDEPAAVAARPAPVAAPVLETFAVPAPPPTVADLVREADALRARGDLVDPPGHNALGVYRGVLEQAPDNRSALAGIDAIGRALAEQGLDDLDAGDEEAARRAFAQAAELAPGAQLVLRLEDALGVLDAGRELVARARQRLDSGDLTQPEDDSAVALVTAALAQTPRPEGAEAVREALVARLEEVAADARAYDMQRQAEPYARAAQTLSAL